MDSVTGLASGANFEGVIKIEEEKIRSHVDQVVRETVEQTLNGLLQAEADELCGGQALRALARATRHALRALRSQVAHSGRRGDIVGATAAEPAVRDRDHRALSAAAVERRGSLGRDVPGCLGVPVIYPLPA